MYSVLTEFAWANIRYDISGNTLGGIVGSLVQNIAAPLIINACEIASFGALVGIVYAGFLYASAMGDSGKAARGKKALKNSIIGAIITKGAAVIGTYIAMVAQAGNGGAEGMAQSISLQLAIWAGSFAVASIVYGAFLYASAGTNPSNAAKGKNTIILACIGLIIIAAAEAILTYFLNKFGVQ
jgi:hypothetical protein